MTSALLPLVDAVFRPTLDEATIARAIGPRAGPAANERAELRPNDVSVEHAWLELDPHGEPEGLVVELREPSAVRVDVLVARFGQPRSIAGPLHPGSPMTPWAFTVERRGFVGSLTIRVAEASASGTAKLVGFSLRRLAIPGR